MGTAGSKGSEKSPQKKGQVTRLSERFSRQDGDQDFKWNHREIVQVWGTTNNCFTATLYGCSSQTVH